jgi:DNA-binding transcriptional ArsR family regulator
MARAFIHPSPKDFTIDGVLYALADPIRRNIVAKLYEGDSMNCSGTCGDLSPSTVSFHHKILRENGLIKSEKIGVEVINTLRAEDLDKRFPGLLASILEHHKNTRTK